jgi:hypothetical protein
MGFRSQSEFTHWKGWVGTAHKLTFTQQQFWIIVSIPDGSIDAGDFGAVNLINIAPTDLIIQGYICR